MEKSRTLAQSAGNTRMKCKTENIQKLWQLVEDAENKHARRGATLV